MKTLILTNEEHKILFKVMESYRLTREEFEKSKREHPIGKFMDYLNSNRHYLSKDEQKLLDKTMGQLDDGLDSVLSAFNSLLDKIKMLDNQTDN